MDIETAKKRGIVFKPNGLPSIIANCLFAVIHQESPGPSRPWTQKGFDEATLRQGRLYCDSLSYSPVPGVVAGLTCRNCDRIWTINELVERVNDSEGKVLENRTGIAYCAACGTYAELDKLKHSISEY
jgi:hypothetical protein